jgi:hypothetical protein
VLLPGFNKGAGISGNKKPHRLIGSGVSEIPCVNQNPTAALRSSSAFSSSRMFKFRITAAKVATDCGRVNGILASGVGGDIRHSNCVIEN